MPWARSRLWSSLQVRSRFQGSLQTGSSLGPEKAMVVAGAPPLTWRTWWRQLWLQPGTRGSNGSSGSDLEHVAAVLTSSNPGHTTPAAMPTLDLPPPCAPCHDSSSSIWPTAGMVDLWQCGWAKWPENDLGCVSLHLSSCRQLPCPLGPEGPGFCGRPLSSATLVV